MEILLIDLNNIECVICNRKFNNLNGLSQHIKYHGIKSIEYTKKYLLNDVMPTCACGCGNQVTIKCYRYVDHYLGHNPNCCWQNRMDKESDEYKVIRKK
jgi:hypothetical protein